MSQHILYGSLDGAALILDLPHSISCAQGSSQRLRSVPALEYPRVSPEPRGSKRDVLLSAVPVEDRKYHQDVQSLLSSALDSIRATERHVSWCLPRTYIDGEVSSNRNDCSAHSNIAVVQKDSSPPLVLSSEGNKLCCLSAFNTLVVQNPFSSATDVVFSTTRGHYFVPAQSTFLDATIEDGYEAFEDAVQCLLPERLFDLVLLDPPWSNRSVRRSQVYKSTEDQNSDPFVQTLLVISKYLARSGCVAIWVTNKSATRLQAISSLRSLGLVLVEEWIWLKVTTQGEPVTALDGIWRKPYEVLMLFRYSDQHQRIGRRVCIAVPDIHSRKPNLKFLFERILPENYNALELFARSLTAGWWSWGNEVLKFQHESYWC